MTTSSDYCNVTNNPLPPASREFLGGVGIFLSLFLDSPPYQHGAFLARNSYFPPKILHRYSIATPSFRWSIYGELMDKRWRNHEGKCLHQ